MGPEEFAGGCARRTAVAVTDTTFRDAHQSLLATRVRTRDLLDVAGHVARTTPQLWSRGGVGRGDVRRGAAVPRRGPLGAAGRAARGGAQHLPADAAARAQHGRLHAVPDRGDRRVRRRGGAATGIDIFRIFDALNDVDADAAGDRRGPRDRDRGRRGARSATPATCSTRTSGSTRSTTTSAWPSGSSAAGAHVLAIKDMAGLLRAPAARTAGHRAARAVRPAGAPAHPRHRRRPAGDPAGRDRRRRGRGRRGLRLDGGHHQPAGAVGAGRRHRPQRAGRPGWTCEAVCDLEPYWEATRRVYAPFESGLPSPTGRVYTHEIPGGQLSNLRQQAIALGLGEKFEQIEDMYAAANAHPRQHRQGDAVARRWSATSRCTWSAVGADPAEFAADPAKFDVPDSVIGFLSGELGDPPGGWPEPFRTRALEGRTVKPRVEELTDERARRPGAATRAHAQRAAVPGADAGVRRVAARSTATSRVLATRDYLYGLRRGEEHEVDARGGQDAAARAARRSATPTSAASARSCARSTASSARSASATARSPPTRRPPRRPTPATPATSPRRSAAWSRRSSPRATRSRPAPTVATIEAMKMEAAITAPVAGTVAAGRPRRHRPGRGRRPRRSSSADRHASLSVRGRPSGFPRDAGVCQLPTSCSTWEAPVLRGELGGRPPDRCSARDTSSGTPSAGRRGGVLVGLPPPDRLPTENWSSPRAATHGEVTNACIPWETARAPKGPRVGACRFASWRRSRTRS